ncbi:type 1 glutamine amidotransferase family protein [Raoultibacter phocaeensis]|uniref:type 1 glutamine amidotransferase family protein n=1 Tax=Raoultibacter phocaeensis TaxID=2479841 RepID=UPI001118ACD7|nr:type 1 glutamine amidotransferase family protein [Raoultibacter phocaeensis]
MYTIYIYILDTLADWELGYVSAELNSRRFFKKDAPHLAIKTVSYSKEPINTMGGVTITPDCLVDDIVASKTSMLLLPGANTWNDPNHAAIIEKASEFLASDATVCAICGATAALADAGLLDARPHTSNGPGFLEMVSPGYKGQQLYRDEPSVADDHLITAGSTGALPWTKHIIERLDVFRSDTLEHWYEYFNSGNSEHFFALMQTLPTTSNER